VPYLQQEITIFSMKKLLLIGAGRSTIYLIKYLLHIAESENWHIRIGDLSLALAQSKAQNHPCATAFEFDVNNATERSNEIAKADIVISMLPAHMHTAVAIDCVQYKKHMITASYVSKEIEVLHSQAVDAGVVILNEMGVDPGLDHLSALKLINEIREKGAELKIFESFTGGLVAPESDNNPWNYKFTWNPRNVVLAGSGGAVKFVQEGMYKYIPYHQVFRRTESIEIEGYGRFEGYANRDSLKYRDVYGLSNIPTIYRGTLRRPGFCRAWDTFVKLGATDDTYIMEDSENMTHRDFINSFLAYNPFDSVELKLMHYMKFDQDDEIMEKLKWLGIFDKTKIGLKNASPAQILQHMLEKKWSLSDTDKDMIVMYHKIGYSLQGIDEMVESSMVCIGEDKDYTAMAKTVGLPLAIGAKLILQGIIKTPGVQLPMSPEIYNPVLKELKEYGIEFIEKQVSYKGY
jgi:saccharopine dehydrogenase-like NADP-dependent oxidoreductase